MKKLLLILTMIVSIVAFGQTEENGTIFKEHPAIDVVESMLQAFAEGDTVTLSSLLADDYRGISGTNTNPDAEGQSKKGLINQSNWMSNNYAYFSIERTPGAYPDALEYKDENAGLWVQTWSQMTAVDKRTGVKLDQPQHRLFVVNEDNKIQTMITYFNALPFNESSRSLSVRENGKLYDQHEYINKVRMVMQAYANHDLETLYSFYDEDARISNIHMDAGESISLEESKEGDKKFFEQFEVNSMDVRGYPDYLNYERRDGKVVQSWWTIKLTRKSDNQKLEVPIFFLHDFNDEGMIVSESAYFSVKRLEYKSEEKTESESK